MLLDTDGRVRFATRRAGVLEVVRSDGELELSLPRTEVERREYPALLAALGVEGDGSRIGGGRPSRPR